MADKPNTEFFLNLCKTSGSHEIKKFSKHCGTYNLNHFLLILDHTMVPLYQMKGDELYQY